MAYPNLTDERIERVGLLACVLFVGILLGWCGGTWASIRVIGDAEQRYLKCPERAE